jgi:hypothetical protein
MATSCTTDLVHAVDLQQRFLSTIYKVKSNYLPIKVLSSAKLAISLGSRPLIPYLLRHRPLLCRGIPYSCTLTSL